MEKGIRHAEEASRKAEYDRKAKIVKELAHAWRDSKLLRDFATALHSTTAAVALASDSSRVLLMRLQDCGCEQPAGIYCVNWLGI